MPSPRKVFLHGRPVLVSSRIEEGLPLVPTVFMTEIIHGILARAQRLFPVELVAFLFERNHFHMIIVILNPEHVSRFIGYLKQETAHAVNRLLGRKKHTVWCKEFDSPTLLDYETLIKYLTYVYTQPQKDGLTETIDDYDGASSWKLFLTDLDSRTCPIIPRNAIPRLKDPRHPWKEEAQVMRQLNQAKLGDTTLLLTPFAWRKCFPESRGRSLDELKSIIVSEVRKREEEHRMERLRKRHSVRGFAVLKKSSMVESYWPKSFGRKMLCLASRKETRASFIHWVKDLVTRSSEVLALWRLGSTQIQYPPGLFAPAMPRLQNTLVPELRI